MYSERYRGINILREVKEVKEEEKKS